MRVRSSWTVLAALVVPAILGTAASVAAATARAQFGIRLVIEPACPDNAPKLIASAAAAVDLAGGYLLIPPHTLSADHDVADTSYWLVRSEQGPVLRIAKCTGAVSLPEAQMQNAKTQNAQSLAEPGASLASN